MLEMETALWMGGGGGGGKSVFWDGEFSLSSYGHCMIQLEPYLPN